MERDANWSDIAIWYDTKLAQGSGPHETALACTLRLCPDLSGQEVLDLACGQGLAARALARAAKSVTGADSAFELLEIARRYEKDDPQGIRYLQEDAQNLSSIADEAFDGVNCQLGLMDIPDLPATIDAVHRVLKPGGWFVFVIGHPCFLAPEAETVQVDAGRPARLVHGYLEERFWRSSNPDGVRRVGNYHRPIATYLNRLTAGGFVIEAVEEPRGSETLIREQPIYAEVPIFFGVRAQRP